MGAVKKVFKSVGGLFGIGGGNKRENVDTSVNTSPIATAVTNTDVSMQEDLVSTAKKKKKGFAAQNTATDNTLVGSAGDKDTLG